jgi:glutaminyl-tRNA synthetase
MEVAKKVSNLKTFESGRWVQGVDNTPELTAAHLAFTQGKPHFRFPPEPNGYLHIGHAKSMKLNFGEAAANEGKCYLRYDDTNPEAESIEYIEAIKEMALWMGWKPDMITFTSDYFDKLYEFAIVLIKRGLAYVDHSTKDEIKKQREDRVDSPWRNRPLEENLKLFDDMTKGKYDESGATLRLKMNMQHDNPNMRDVIAYRIKYCPHPHIGDKWCIYPSYDYTHCIIDSLENIDYSLCTLEFEIRRESYYWVLEALGLYRPHVWEFSRLNVTGSLLSKRKINALVVKGIVRGFDDPRLLTLAGLRRRGYTPEAINEFCDLVGVTRVQNVIDIKMLEFVLRQNLDANVPRRFGLIKPLRVVVKNYAASERKSYEAQNHPKRAELGTRPLFFQNEFFIDYSDFREVDDKKYYGLAPNPAKAVGLKFGPNVSCVSYDKDAETGEVTCVYVEVDLEKKVKPKTHIHWLAKDNAIPAEIRLYEPLLTDDRAAIEPDFIKYVNPQSENVMKGLVEADLARAPIRSSYQFERVGYFTVDQDTKPGEKLVFNRIISLKEDADKGGDAAEK